MSRLLILATALAFVVTGAMAAPVPPPAARSDSPYRLRAEDVIEVTVLGHTQLDKTVTILPDGTISFPRLGTIEAVGKTVEELKTLLYQGLDHFYNNLQITVSVKALRADRATVTGAVRTQGIVDVRRGWTVRELLAAAGGLLTVNGPPAPDQMRATLIRRSGERIPLSLAQLICEQGAPDLPAVEPDDVLSVEDLTIQVAVDGQVGQPGKNHFLPPGATALDALQAAGGPTKEAALTRAVIRRGNEYIPVNLRPFIDGTSAAPPPVLQRFDTLYIPENKERILVLGGVQKPGAYLLPEEEKITLPDALALAGGHVPHARLNNVSLLHKGENTVISVNLEQMLKKGDTKKEFALQPGDRIYVPDPKAPSPLNPLSILQTIALFGIGIP